MKTEIKLESLNLSFNDFLVLIYHATGKNFIYRFKIVTSKGFGEFEKEVFEYCKDINFVAKNIFPNEEEIFGVIWAARYESQDIFAKRRAVETVINWLRRFRRFSANFTVLCDRQEFIKLRTSETPIYNWLIEKVAGNQQKAIPKA